MSVVVTGGAGFIGSHVVDALLESGEHVVILDDLSTGSKENLAQALDRGAELRIADIRDEPEVERIVEEVAPSVIFHLAAQTSVARSLVDPVADAAVNIDGTTAVLRAAHLDGECRVVFASTGGMIYGEGAGRELPFTEDAECLPTVPYGRSKLAAEGQLELHRRLYGLSSVSLRLANVYGPRQDPAGEAGAVAIFSGRLLAGQPPIVFGDGSQTRDYVFVGDVVQAIAAAGRADVEGVLNIGTGRETSVLDLLERLNALAKTAPGHETAPPRAGEVQRVAIDPKRAVNELGWSASVALEDGLRKTFEWFRAGRG